MAHAYAHAKNQSQIGRPRQVHNPARQSNMSTGGKVALALGGLVVGSAVLFIGVPLVIVALAARKANEQMPTIPPTGPAWPTEPTSPTFPGGF